MVVALCIQESFTLLVKYSNGCIEEKGKGERNIFIFITPRKQSSRLKISGLVISSNMISNCSILTAL